MTDQELIAYLKLQGLEKDIAAAEYIEELEKRCSLYARADRLFVEEINDLNAKLTKAMEALRETTQMLSQCTFTIIRMGGRYFERHEVVDKARAVLAELEAKE